MLCPAQSQPLSTYRPPFVSAKREQPQVMLNSQSRKITSKVITFMGTVRELCVFSSETEPTGDRFRDGTRARDRHRDRDMSSVFSPEAPWCGHLCHKHFAMQRIGHKATVL